MDNINHAFELIGEQFLEGTVFWMILFGLVLVITLIYFLRGIYIHSKRVIESVNFMVLCVPIIIWSFLIIAGPLFGLANKSGTLAHFGIVSCGVLIPVLLMLHIWSQVSYRPITIVVRIAWMIVPAILIVVEAMKVSDPGFEGLTLFNGQLYVFDLVVPIYFVIIIIKSFLLCFNVFYQMPKHMRRSTNHMITAITTMLVAFVITLYFGFTRNTDNLIFAVAYIIAVHSLYTAFFISNSSNVIVTSRDFVFSSLSTIVITVSLKGNILDWNHKKKDGCYPLPDPKYKEPYPLYRKRIIETMGGTVSPFDDNILCLDIGDREYHLMFTWHDVSYHGRKFGYLVEVSEITKSYSKLRNIEAIAYYDNLTGLKNRNAYIEEVKQISVADNMPLLIIVGDVNNLKKTNDSLGHLFGDKLILYITDAIKKKAPEGAFIARIGGDEIVLLVKNADEKAAVEFMTGVTEILNSINDPDIGVPSISWGFSVMHDATESYNDVFRAADAIMYEAKKWAHEASSSGVIPQR